MLRRLHIQNLALIDRAEVVFTAGLTVLTGESGAGKSLIVRALSLALGARSDREDIGSFAPGLTVEAEFDCTTKTASFMVHYDLENVTKDETITLRREISAAGRSRAFVNDQLVKIEQLAQIGDTLCRIQGQAAGFALRQEARQLETLDEFAGALDDVATIGESFDSWEKTKRNISKLKANQENIEQERELLLFQQRELETADLSVSEEETLIDEKKRLDAAEKLIQNCELIEEALEGENSPVEALNSLRRTVNDICATDKTFKEQHDLFDSTLIQLEELRRSLSVYRSELFVDDQRLEEINQRLSDVYQIKNKYGGSTQAALDKLAAIKERLSALPDTGAELTRLAETEALGRTNYSKLALAVRKKRFSAAATLCKRTRQQLTDLAIPQNQFEFSFNWTTDATGIAVTEGKKTLTIKPERHGLESGAFYFSANPGEEPKPLSRVASGGEMSRALLALNVAALGSAKQTQSKSAKATKATKAAKTTQKNKMNTAPVNLFDEVDTGVSGVAASAMGAKLRELSLASQTLVVTHLRQVVSFADQHLLIEKQAVAGRNQVSARALSATESKAEALRMVDIVDNTKEIAEK